MKIILLIQTLIIIIGSYFLYQEIMSDDAVVTEVIVEEVVEPSDSVQEPVPEIVEESTTAEVAPVVREDLDGHTDQGMEWPVLEMEAGIEMQ